MPVRTDSVHAHILTKPSRAGFAVIRLELVEPGAETCAARDLEVERAAMGQRYPPQSFGEVQRCNPLYFL